VRGNDYKLVQQRYFRQSHIVYTYPANRNDDITGYYINATKPISVVAGHSCAFVPEGVSFCDHIVEHIPPVSELGLTHVVPPIIGRLADAGYSHHRSIIINYYYYTSMIHTRLLSKTLRISK